MSVALVVIRVALDPRFSRATAREPPTSGFTHTSPPPEEDSSVPWTPAGSWSIAITSLFCTAARLARLMRVQVVTDHQRRREHRPHAELAAELGR